MTGGDRVQLLSPINGVVELSEMLLRDVDEQEHGDLAGDLRKIRDSGLAVREALREVFDTGPEAIGDAARLRHDLRNPLSSIIGYCDLWLEDAEEVFLDGFAGDLGTIRSLGRQLLEGVETAFRDDEAAARLGSGEFRTISEARPPAAPALVGNLLVVDDNATGRELLVRRLERQGHRVAEAVDGRRALELAAAGPFDLILLDVLMPGVDGFEVLRRLKADPATRGIPVVMITGLDDLDGVVRSIRLGAEDYLPRPINGVLLDARIGACLEKKRLQDNERVHLAQIDRERKRYDELLRCILPGKVIDELKVSNAVKPIRSDGVAVLFADLVGFTKYCNGHPPEAVVDLLQRLVEAWDRVAADWGLEKIKNIGDGFLAASGLLEPAADPVWACVNCGRALVAAAKGLGDGWNARVGIHVGPVIAGVLGRRQFLFDIWGDTVNTASRVESNGQPGCVNMSRDAYDRVCDRLPPTLGRLVDIKGIGPFEILSLDAAADLDPRLSSPPAIGI